MGEYAEMLLTGVCCETCGEFIGAESMDHPRKCDFCFDEELVQAVEEDVWPDGISFTDWQDIKRQYSEPDIRA